MAEFDYSSPGAYFITTCVRKRENLLGRVVGDRVRLTKAGQAMMDVWSALPSHYPRLVLDAFVVMPDHVHGILVLESEDRDPVSPPTTSDNVRKRRSYGLSEVVRAFKTFSARRINLIRGTPGRPVWQRGFYDHVIRNDRELERIRQYVLANPARWSWE